VVLAPAATGIWYLYGRAADQYASTTGFAVRTEEASSAVDILGGLSNLSSASSSDTDILFEFIQGQQLVTGVASDLDLRAYWSRPHDTDPIFAFEPGGTVEDLIDYWGRMVRIDYDGGTGLIELRINAFDPDEAQAIAQAIFDRSAAMINELGTIARQDATRYAREELTGAVERLKQAREAVTAFRSRNQIIDPTLDLQGQMGLLQTLQAQLASALIELDLLRSSTRENDPRISQAQLRIDVIERRIEDERDKISVGTGTGAEGNDYVALLGEFERLTVDREFAEAAYVAALTAFDAAQAEAQRQSRYLAAYVEPTLAEEARYPRRGTLAALLTGFLLLSWAILMLLYYSVRDRR
jgi:capsular polysaccharide transport system permease protein